MKKTLLALLLVLALCASLFGCGEKKDGADYVFESLANLENAYAEMFAPVQTEAPARFELSVADISSLCTLLGADPGMPLGAAAFGVTADGGNGVADLSLALGDKTLTLEAFSDGENIILASNQLSSAYGATAEEFLALIGELSGMDFDAALDQVQSMDPAAMEALDARYEELLETLVRENIEFTVEEDGKNVIVSCVLTPENVAAVGSALIAEMQSDAEMLALIEKMSGEEAKAEITDVDVDKDAMIADLTEVGFGGELSFTVVEKTSELVGMDMEITADETPVTLQYAEGEEGISFTVQAEDTVLGVDAEISEEAATVVIKSTVDGTETMTATLDFSADSIDVTISAGGDTVGVEMGYTATETAVEVVLNEVSFGGFGIDLSQYGIKLTLDTAAEMPEAPAEYTSVAEYTAEDLQGILFEFIMNSGLLAYMQ